MLRALTRVVILSASRCRGQCQLAKKPHFSCEFRVFSTVNPVWTACTTCTRQTLALHFPSIYRFSAVCLFPSGIQVDEAQTLSICGPALCFLILKSHLARSTRTMKRFAFLFLLTVRLVPLASAQETEHFQLGVNADYLRLSQTDTNFAGVGARLGFLAFRNIKLEAEVNYDFDQAVTDGFTTPQSAPSPSTAPPFASCMASSGPRSISANTGMSIRSCNSKAAS